MKYLSNMSFSYLQIISSIISGVDQVKAEQLQSYLFPPARLNVTVEEQRNRWFIIDEAANEVGFDDVQRVLQKIDKLHAKTGGRSVLSDRVTYEIVAKCLANSSSDTQLFNAFLTAIIQKVK